MRNVDTNAQKNNTTNDGDVQYSNYWYPQMSKTDLEYVKRRAKYELDTTENYIDNITKWLYNVKNGNTYFVLYSTEDANEPTILYACKANRAKNEQAWFVRFIEELRSIDNGNYEQSTSVLNQMLETFWNEYKSNNRHSGNGLGRGSNNRNVRATNQKTNFKPSEALFNCLRNIAKISDTDGADLNKGSAFSMPENDDEVSYSFEITPEQDAEYLEAVNNGDMETAQRLVDEAAERAGYTVKAYHGTPNGNFTKFDTNKIASTTDAGIFGRGFYFTTHKETADVYATENGKTMPVYLQSNNPWWAVAHRNIQEVSEKLGMEESALTLRGYGGKGRIVTPTMSQSGQFSAHLQEHGYDSVIVQHGKNNYEIVVFDSNAIKSADAITYDDNGNVIPLSQRFNEDNNDIRYSFEDDVVDKTSSLAERVRLGEISQTEYLNELQRLMNEATEKYGAIPKGENPKVDVTVPKQVSDKRNTRRKNNKKES